MLRVRARIPFIVMRYHCAIAASTSFKHFSGPTIVKSSPWTTQRTFHTGCRHIVGAAFPLTNPILDAGPLISAHNSIQMCFRPFEEEPLCLEQGMAAKRSSRMPSPLIFKVSGHQPSSDFWGLRRPLVDVHPFVETGGFPVIRKHSSIVQSSYKPPHVRDLFLASLFHEDPIQVIACLHVHVFDRILGPILVLVDN